MFGMARVGRGGVALLLRPLGIARPVRTALRRRHPSLREVRSSPREDDEHYMWLALEEAEKARDKGEVPVGAVMIDSHGDVIARAHNTVETTNDPTNHAEMLCLRKASKSQESWRLLDTTLFVTLEPCPMCVGALLQSRVGRVVWGAPNKQLGADGSWISLLRGSGETKHPYHLSVQVSRNVLEEECSLLLKEFFRRRRAENDNAGSSDVPR